MNGMIQNATYKQVPNEYLNQINSLTLPNGVKINSMGAYQGICPCCDTKQRGLLDMGGKDMAFFCTEANTVVLGEYREAPMILNRGAL